MIRQCDLKVICLFDVNWLIYCEQVEDYNYLMCRDRDRMEDGLMPTT